MTNLAIELSTQQIDAIQFQVCSGMRRVDCIISGQALDAASGLDAFPTTASRRRSFDRFRMMIQAAAMLKLEALPADFSGSVCVTSDDLRNLPIMMGEPMFGKKSGVQGPKNHHEIER